MIAGVYAACPFISGWYGDAHNTDKELLPSLAANDGIFINSNIWALMVDLYIYADDAQHREENKRDPLCWPFWAQPARDLAGLPPHVITVNELDGLRDEGLHYYRQLLAAGVPARCVQIHGTCHAADLIFRKHMPDLYASTLHNVRQFALGLK